MKSMSSQGPNLPSQAAELQELTDKVMSYRIRCLILVGHPILHVHKAWLQRGSSPGPGRAAQLLAQVQSQVCVASCLGQVCVASCLGYYCFWLGAGVKSARTQQEPWW